MAEKIGLATSQLLRLVKEMNLTPSHNHSWPAAGINQGTCKTYHIVADHSAPFLGNL